MVIKAPVCPLLLSQILCSIPFHFFLCIPNSPIYSVPCFAFSHWSLQLLFVCYRVNLTHGRPSHRSGLRTSYTLEPR